MTVLVTGGAGFIGSNLVRFLLANSAHKVVVVDSLTYAGDRMNLPSSESEPRLTFHQASICDSLALQEIFEAHSPAAVLHLAAETHVDRSIDGPADFVNTNFVGTFNLLEAARRNWSVESPSLTGIGSGRNAFIHVSTDEVFGTLAPNDPAFDESTPYDPRSPYSATKAGSDHLVRAWYHTYGLPTIVTNCSNNYGPYQFPEKLIPVVIISALLDKPIPVYGAGENIRDWLYVEDHARALTRILEEGSPGETYAIGGNNEQRNIDLVEKICVVMDELRPRGDGLSYTSQITYVADRPGHDLRYAINSELISARLNWKAIEDPYTGLRKTVAWYLSNQQWWSQLLAHSAPNRLGGK